ncbi:MAG: hypothetical protein K8T91_06835 [Planctomycetes bacterium]|nr:hypothetical protein [Planctomycetota bacterium]
MAPHIFAKIDGPLFRQQRALLLKLADQANNRKPCPWAIGDRELLEGLLELTDAIADEAHDQYEIPCVLTKEPTLKQPEPCECQLPGDFCCGVPGILTKVENCRVVPGAKSSGAICVSGTRPIRRPTTN